MNQPPLSHRPVVALALLALICAGFAGCGRSSSTGSSSATADARATDAQAKADARATVTAMETCFTDNQSYRSCTASTLSGLVPKIKFGSGPEQVEVSATDQTYKVTAHAQSGNTFVIDKGAQGSLTRSCTEAVAGGCTHGTW